MNRKYPNTEMTELFPDGSQELRDAISVKDKLKEYTEKYGKARTRAIFEVFEDMFLRPGAKREIKKESL